jgi:outer membrane receptor protein involved in Fe transport
MSVFKWIMACSALCCLLSWQAVVAQDTGQSPKKEENCPEGANCPQKAKKPELKPETIIVTAGFQDGAVALEPTKTVIDVTKYEQSNSIDRVEDILRNMAGIDVINGTGGADPQQMIMMRGFDDSRFQVAIDGRPVTAPTAGADTYVDWSSLTMGNIEKIEIIRGAASARFENSAGGVINIITRKGKRGDNLTPKATAETAYSSFNTVTTRGMINGGISNLGYIFNFGSRNSDGSLRNNYWDGVDYSGRLDYALPNKAGLSASFKRNDLEYGYPVVNSPTSRFTKSYDSNYPIVSDDADTLRIGRLIAYPGGKSLKIRKETHFDAGYDQPIGNTKLSLKYFMDRGSEDSYSYQLTSPTKGPLVQTFSGQAPRQERVWGAMLDYQLNIWANHAISVGLSHRRMGVEDNKDSFRISGAYLEDQVAVTNKLILNLGVRLMAVREMGYAYADPGVVPAVTYRHKIFTRRVLPKFTASYHFNPTTEVFFSANKDYHLPGC